MIWALLAWFLLSLGGAHNQSALMLSEEGLGQLVTAVEDTVKEEDRRLHAIRPLKVLRNDIEAFEDVFLNSGMQLIKLYESHENTTAEANEILEELNTAWADVQAKALDARFELRDSLTEEEWRSLFNSTAEEDLKPAMPSSGDDLE